MQIMTLSSALFSSDEIGVINASAFGYPSGAIFLDSVHCTGVESGLWDCNSSPLHMCSHQNDVAILCHRKCITLTIEVHSTNDCADAQVPHTLASLPL